MLRESIWWQILVPRVISKFMSPQERIIHLKALPNICKAMLIMKNGYPMCCRRGYGMLLNATKQYVYISSARVYADCGDEVLTETCPRLLDVC